MKITRRIASIILAAAMILAFSAAAAETEAPVLLHEEFTELGFSLDIPSTIMYITMASPEDAPLYSLLTQAGYTYDSFREIMSSNQILSYGLFLTDQTSVFQISGADSGQDINYNSLTDDELNITLESGKAALEGIGAIVLESEIVHGARNQGVRYCYRVTTEGVTQEVIQYSFMQSGYAVNVRAFGYSNASPDNDGILRDIFDSIVTAE